MFTLFALSFRSNKLFIKPVLIQTQGWKAEVSEVQRLRTWKQKLVLGGKLVINANVSVVNVDPADGIAGGVAVVVTIY